MITPAASRWCRVLLCSAALLVCARPAEAEWQFAPFFGWEFGGHTSLFDLEFASNHMHRAFGVTVTRLSRGPIALEGTALYVPGFFNDPRLHGQSDVTTGSRTYAVMGNLVLVAPQRWNEYGLRPYVSGGLGVLRAREDLRGPEAQIVFSVNKSLFGANIGGGAVGFITDRTGVRFDLRFFTTVRTVVDNETVAVGGRTHLRYWATSVGLVLR